MARRAAPAKLERMAAPEGSEFASMTREQLLQHTDQRSAADEIYRRAFNKMISKSES